MSRAGAPSWGAPPFFAAAGVLSSISPKGVRIVLKNPKAQMALVLAVGLLAGYAVASGKLNPFQKAQAGPQPDEPHRAGVLLTAHNNAVQENAAESGKRPNILVLWADDIAYWNVSAYNHGAMGYRTPNIDRIAREGALFTDCYAQQSCTAGRAAFITGQSPFRTGLLNCTALRRAIERSMFFIAATRGLMLRSSLAV